MLRFHRVQVVALFLALLALPLRAAVPTTYYNSANTLTSTTLRASLNDIVSFGNVYTPFSNSTISNPVLSAISASTVTTNKSVILYGAGDTRFNTTHTLNGDPLTGGWSREHTFPESFFNYATPMVDDMNALFPADADINSTERNDKYYDTVSGGSTDGYGNKFNSTVFEPNDTDKGNAARTIFYMDVRYEGESGEPNLFLANTGTVGTGNNLMRQLSTMLAWHSAHPPSNFEVLRNGRNYDVQNNANPFIDHPEWVGIVYGTTPTNVVQNGDTITVGSTSRTFAQTPPGFINAPMLGLNLTLGADQWDIGSLTISTAGSTLTDAEITSVRLWLDADNDGLVNRVDPQLDHKTLSGGTATFNLATPFRLIPGTRSLLITATIATTATAGRTLQVTATANGLIHSATGGADVDPTFSAQTCSATTIGGTPGKVNIVAVSTHGSLSTTSTSYEYVVLANSSPYPVSIAGWNLKRRSASGVSGDAFITGGPLTGVIPSQGHYVIASYNYGPTAGAVEGGSADFVDSSTGGLFGGISDTSMFEMALVDDLGAKVDGFSFNGAVTNSGGERDGTAFAVTMTATTARRGVIHRKRPGGTAGPYTDTDDNNADLELVDLGAGNLKPPPSDLTVPVELSNFSAE